MNQKYVIIGNFTIDNIVSTDGIVSPRKAGGNAVFSAIGAHIWSDEVGILTTIPINYPSNYLEELERGGIHIEGIKKLEPAVDSEEWFFYDSDGNREDRLFTSKSRSQTIRKAGYRLNLVERAALIEEIRNDPEPGVSFADFRRANPLSFNQIDFESFPAKAFHIAPNNMIAQLSIASYLKTKGAFISLDPPFLKSPIQESELERLLTCVDCFLPSLKELNALYPDLEPVDAIHRLSRFGPLAIGVKLGVQGSLVWSQSAGKIAHIPAYPTDCVVDLTGAGDAYCGGFLVGMQETGDPFVAAKYGTVTASLIIEQPDLSSRLKCTRNHAVDRLKQILALPKLII